MFFLNFGESSVAGVFFDTFDFLDRVFDCFECFLATQDTTRVELLLREAQEQRSQLTRHVE